MLDPRSAGAPLAKEHVRPRANQNKGGSLLLTRLWLAAAIAAIGIAAVVIVAGHKATSAVTITALIFSAGLGFLAVGGT